MFIEWGYIIPTIPSQNWLQKLRRIEVLQSNIYLPMP